MRYNASKKVFQSSDKKITFDGTYVRHNGVIKYVKLGNNFSVRFGYYNGLSRRQAASLTNIIGECYCISGIYIRTGPEKYQTRYTQDFSPSAIRDALRGVITEIAEAKKDLAKEIKKEAKQKKSGKTCDDLDIADVESCRKYLDRHEETYMALAMLAKHYKDAGMI